MSCSSISRTRVNLAALSAIYKKNDYALVIIVVITLLIKDGSLFKMISELLGFKDGCSKLEVRAFSCEKKFYMRIQLLSLTLFQLVLDLHMVKC